MLLWQPSFDLLFSTEFCKHRYMQIKKVSTIPIGIIKMIAILTGNKELKSASNRHVTKKLYNLDVFKISKNDI